MNSLVIFTLTALLITGMSIVLCAGQTEEGSAVLDSRRLYHKLLTDYESSVRPAHNETEIVQVAVGLWLHTIDEINEQDQTMTVTGYISRTWTDFQLQWNPQDFGEKTTLEVYPRDIWTPGVGIINSKWGMYDQVIGGHQIITVYHTGLVVWSAMAHIKTPCNIDLTSFPYDSQTCRIKLTSLFYGLEKVNITVDSHFTNDELGDLQLEELNGVRQNWDVTGFDVKVPFWFYKDHITGEYLVDFNTIIYYVSLRRISNFASHLFVAPSMILCFLTPLVFLLPPTSHEKMALGVGVLISDVLLVGELIRFIPGSYRTIPLIVKYLLSNIVLTSLSLVISTIVINVWGRSRTRLNMPGPAFIRLIVLGPVAKFLCVSEDQYYDESDDLVDDQRNSVNLSDMANAQNETTTQSNESRSRELKLYLRKVAMSQWNQLAVVIDRFFIILYLLVISGLTLAFTQYM